MTDFPELEIEQPLLCIAKGSLEGLVQETKQMIIIPQCTDAYEVRINRYMRKYGLDEQEAQANIDRMAAYSCFRDVYEPKRQWQKIMF